MIERIPSPRCEATETVSSIPATRSRGASGRQRHALAYLARFEYPVELGTLAAYVAAAERNLPVDSVTDRTREEVAVALHHVDLPNLVAAGTVRYDPEGRMVVMTESRAVERYVDTTDGSRSSGPV